MANRKARFDSRIFTIRDLEIEATKRLSRHHAEYFNHGAGDMTTLLDNEAAFNRYKLRPRVMIDVSAVDMSTEIFGQKVSFPLGFAPTAGHKIVHPDAEIATSRAAAKNKIPMALSSWSTTRLEDVVIPDAAIPYVMQLTFLKDLNYTLRIIQRAEKAGYKAILVSVDLPVLGNRLNEARNNFTFPKGCDFPNLKLLQSATEGEIGVVAPDGLDYDASIVWEKNIPWLREHTKMEIWLKGVYTAEDVELAIQHGVDGVIISNHGGRQLDGVPATLDALRECAPVAKNRIKIALDGGIRRGSDLFKALALGADFCFAGRVAIWGLAYNGEDGVDLAVKILMYEFYTTMMLTGCKTIKDIKRSYLSVLQNDGILSKL